MKSHEKRGLISHFSSKEEGNEIFEGGTSFHLHLEITYITKLYRLSLFELLS